MMPQVIRSIYSHGLVTTCAARYRSRPKYTPFITFPANTCSTQSDMSYTSSAPPAGNAVVRSPHPLLTAFQSQRPALGAWLMLPGILHARFVAQASEHLDWVVIDSEHGLTNLQSAAESIIAIESSRNGNLGPSPLVRISATGRDVEQGSGWQIKYALDAGARGVMVPMVQLLFLTNTRVIYMSIRDQ
jgi:HpcH/HpaI aldolase/citrate lyase family